MGNSVICCRSTGAEEEPPCILCTQPGARSVDAEEDDVRSRQPKLLLSGIKLEDVEADSLGDALRDLHEAVRLFKRGDCLEAAEKLASAETVVETSPASASRASLMKVSQTDPDLVDLKQLISASSLKANQEEYGGFVEDDVSGENEAGTEGSDKGSDKLQALETELATVRELCREGRVYDAHDALEAFQRSMESCKKLATESGDKKLTHLVEHLDQTLKIDPMLTKLVKMHPRMVEALRVLKLPADSRGVSVTVKDPVLGEAFTLLLHIRFAEGAERVKDGPSTQLIITLDMTNLPCPLINAICENCEADLFRKEWMQDCIEVRGKPGRPPRLYTASVHGTISPPLLPIRIEDVLLREFAVCPGDGGLPGRGPGVVVLEHRPPEGVTEFEGTTIPPRVKGRIRITGGCTAAYKTQSRRPDCTNIVAVAAMGLPVPQWMLPLSLLKTFAADSFLNTLKKLKVGLYDQWETSEYKDRAGINPEFYGLVKSLPPDNVPIQPPPPHPQLRPPSK